MKKILLVLAIGAFAACNDGGTAEAPKTDSPAVTVDSPAAPVTVDTTVVKTTDTTVTKVDTTKK